MKKLTLLLLLALPFISKATNYTSINNGNWSSSATWSPTGVPGSTDTVTIANTVTLNANESVKNITINSSKTLTVSGSSTLTVYGNFTNNGTFTYSTGSVIFNGSSAQTISGATTFYNLTISSSNTVTLGSAVTVNSTFLLSSGTFDVSSSNYGLTVVGNFTNNGGTFNAESGTVTLNGGTQTLGGTNSTTFYNLTKTGTGTATLGVNTTISNNLTISAGTLSLSTYNLTLGGNFTDNANFTNTSVKSTFILNGSANQTVSGTAMSIIFHNLTINTASASDTVIFAKFFQVTDSMAISSGSIVNEFGIEGNSTGTMTMSAGTNLINGYKSSGAQTFPSNFTNAHINLNSSSTVIYNANLAQIVSSTPTYGNLIISGSNSKTPSSTPLTIDGNLTISSGATLNETTKNVNLSGNLTNNGTLSFSTGALNIGGTFTNNGTYTYGTGTVTFNGSANQNITGSTAPTFYNLTENQASSTDTLFLSHTSTVNNTLTTTQGILDCKGNQMTNSATPVISISPSTSTICAGSSTTLAASGYTTYIWAPSSSLNASTGSSVTASPFTTVTYTVYGNTSNTYECATSTSSTGNVTVNYCEKSCSVAIPIGQGSYDAIPINHKNMWFSFTASGNVDEILVHNQPDTLHGRVIKISLYSGTCSSMTLVQSDTIGLDPFQADSLGNLSALGLTSGNTYYIDLLSDDSTTARTFNLYLHKKLTHALRHHHVI